jgi:fructosamine-3-kinase
VVETSDAFFMSRRDIYYWKCDRPAAFHGSKVGGQADEKIEPQLGDELRRHFGTQEVWLKPGAGRGNHRTWNADVAGRAMFVRVENGPEGDGHLALESEVLDRVRSIGVPTPRVWGYDASRERVAFAWQVLDRIAAPDLNHWFKRGELEVLKIAFEIGAAVGKWQEIGLSGFGVLDEGLSGYHESYRDYFQLRLGEHLAFLVGHGFLNRQQGEEMVSAIEEHDSLLALERGCLVHKDLALWNILGSAQRIEAFIDFDDVISGDAMDDLSLLGCFHDAAFVGAALEGYQSERGLPEEWRRRFWLHLLRNMIVKAVIRLGSGFFDCDDGHFLIAGGSSGREFREFTQQRLFKALQCLRENADIGVL